MNVELIVIGIMAVTLGVIMVEYLRLREELVGRRREEERVKDRARERAGRLVDEAKDRAVEIVREAEVLSQRQADDLERRLRKATRENVQEYAQVMREMAGKMGKEAWGTLGQKIEEEYDRARAEVEKYKQEKKAKLDEQAVEIVKELGKRVLGKIIPAEEHKGLIMEALKEVEEENGF